MDDEQGATAESAEAAGGPAAAEAGYEPKAIILFSDGTGNSSAKLFKTNVWRLYEAVDLGPATKGKRPQVAFYDDGVGTSGIGILAAVTGVFGYGLKRNVLDIYRYACRNYKKDDEIYGFGFSRGGFTMRVVAALIDSQGLVAADTEMELNRRTLDAYRAFRRKFLPNRLSALVVAGRHVRDLVLGLWRRLWGIPAYNDSLNARPPIRFLGIWDTVSAYGGPILEITRAIDDWIFPLSMPDYELSETVQCARHALALDDSRDAFHPLLWDEVHEAGLVAAKKVSDNRLQQVWFAGMHADVGGGYPDESLSYVSLLWIIEEAEAAGLRCLDVITDRHRALASSFGPLHDSRAGPGSYYRYQPRRIGAWIDPPESHTQVLRDLSLHHPDGRPRGLLQSVKVHESVIARIADGTDNYAPITLPGHFRIEPPQSKGETAPQADSETPQPDQSERPRTLVTPETRRRLEEDPKVREVREEASEWIWDAVLQRRLIYFATLAATAWIVMMPFSRRWTRVEDICSDDRCVLPWMISQTKVLVPKFAERWIDAWVSNPVAFALGLVMVLFLLWFGHRSEAKMRDGSLRIWNEALGRPDPEVRPRRALARFGWSALRKIRTSNFYQGVISTGKWRVLPLVIGLAMLLALLYAALAAATQVWLAFAEPSGRLCDSPAAPRGQVIAGPVEVMLDISRPCTPTSFRVEANTGYRVTFTEVKSDSGEPGTWYDSSHAGSPEGIDAGTIGLFGRLGAPFRRLLGARYIQPLAEIRSAGTAGRQIQLRELEVKERPGEPEVYDADFTTSRGGALSFSVNDVTPPLGLHRFFYGNNRGTAKLTVTPYRPVSNHRRGARAKRPGQGS
jgi:uncharacterized protein (DUF2235 family)